MPRHIEFRNDANTALARIRDHATNFVLRVVKAIRAHALKLGKFLALDAEALVFREMPVKHVQLHCSHAIEVTPQHVKRDKVAAYINHQSPPGEARAVFDRNCSYGKPCARGLHQLQNSLQPAHDAKCCGRVQPGAGGADLQAIRFILPQLLDVFGAAGRLNQQSGIGGIRDLHINGRHSDLPAQLPEE